MTGKKREQGTSDNLDRLGQRIVRAAADNDEVGERAAASPFLYTRLRATINAERSGREERERWRALFGVVWRAVPAMALVTLFAVILFLSYSVTRSLGGYVDEALLGERDAGVERVVFATDRQPLSSDDVLATILNDEERGASR
ncbi:MAG: hypothetical protein LC731_00135 [Acidobacteria bacterium]|nr:hypothetical protein [Acidobacteriota bacterium]